MGAEISSTGGQIEIAGTGEVKQRSTAQTDRQVTQDNRGAC